MTFRRRAAEGREDQDLDASELPLWPTGRRLGVCLVSLLSVGACSEKQRAPKPSSSASTTHTVPASLPPATMAAASAGTPPPSPAAEAVPTSRESDDPADGMMSTTACRAITVRGAVSAREGGKRVAAGDPLEKPLWLDLAPGATLAVKDAKTSREVVFHGPGHVLPCERGEERFLMTEGSAATAAWAGSRPGAEVLIATPFGVVRYSDATLDIRLTARSLRVQATVGNAVIDVGDGTTGQRVLPGSQAERKGGRVDVKALVAECVSGARIAESLARDVLSPGQSKVPLGVRAHAHVLGRVRARLQCAMAAAALGTLKMGQDRDDLSRVVAKAEAQWRGVPGLSRHRDP